jgi:hypothetical protein
LDLNTFLKHLLWQISLMLILVAVFHYVLEIIDYSSFLLSVILIAVVLVVLMVLFVWNVFKRQLLEK